MKLGHNWEGLSAELLHMRDVHLVAYMLLVLDAGLVRHSTLQWLPSMPFKEGLSLVAHSLLNKYD